MISTKEELKEFRNVTEAVFTDGFMAYQFKNIMTNNINPEKRSPLVEEFARAIDNSTEHKVVELSIAVDLLLYVILKNNMLDEIKETEEELKRLNCKEQVKQ